MTTEFKLFLQFFPEVTLPVLLTADEQLLFSANNEALPLDLVSRFLLQKTADSEIDEFTEYVPCFQLPDTAPIYGVVYWRAALLQYDYILASFDANGVLLDAQSIGGSTVEGQTVRERVATIAEDGFIFVATGAAHYKAGATHFESEAGKLYKMELRNDGKIEIIDTEIVQH